MSSPGKNQIIIDIGASKKPECVWIAVNSCTDLEGHGIYSEQIGIEHLLKRTDAKAVLRLLMLLLNDMDVVENEY